jgi:hypothetical protein
MNPSNMLTFCGNSKFSLTMTSINNVNRSLTTSRSIINSFLKVIALMCLFTTAGFVGDPSGLANDKKIPTQVAAFSSFAVSDKEEVKPSSLLVLSLPTIVGIRTDTSISFLEKKINLRLVEKNHPSCLPCEEEEVFVYSSRTGTLCFVPFCRILTCPMEVFRWSQSCISPRLQVPCILDWRKV